MSKVKVGIVGLGWVSTGHMQAFKANPNVEIVAVCSRRDWPQEELERIYGPGVKLYKDYSAFLDHPGLQMVDICTEHRLHPDQTVQAAEKGKHLMIEKPLSLDFVSLERMRNAIEKNGVKSTVCFELRFIPHFKLIHSLLRDNLIGDVHYIEVDYYHGIGPWYGLYEWHRKKAEGGSSLLTAGAHALDALLYFKGGNVQEVQAYSTRSKAKELQGYEYDSTSVSLIRFEDGTLGKCASCIDARQPYLFNIHILGSEGSIWNNKMWSSRLDGVSADKWIELPTVMAESGDVLAHPYGPQVDDFVDAILSDRDSSLNFAEAYKTHKTVFAIEEALVSKKAVKLSSL